MQHDLARVGPHDFQDLAAALAVAEFGPQVQIPGPGRDGGRDMFCDGTIRWSGADGESAETWGGYTVFQAKHKDRLEARPADNAAWLWGQIRKELNAWADPESNRDPVPNYLVIVTNVPLTPTPESGGFDKVNASLQAYLDLLADGTRDANEAATAARQRRQRRMSRLRAWRIWDGNQVDGLITKHESVRRVFGAFLTVADVLAHLGEFTDKLPLDELEGGLRRHARAALIGDRSIYFDEAGAGGGEGTPSTRSRSTCRSVPARMMSVVSSSGTSSTAQTRSSNRA